MLTTEKAKQRKKFILKPIMLLLLVIIAIGMSILTACGEGTNVITPNKEGNKNNGNTDDTGHTHEFVVADKYLVEKANCMHGNIYYLSCECGEVSEETFDDGLLAEHTYSEIISDDALVSVASCTEPAEYYKVCSVCGEKSNETFTVGTVGEHNFTEVVSDEYLASKATCESPAEYYKVCSICGEKGETFTDPNGSLAEHDFDNSIAYEITSATCKQGAGYRYHCSVCGAESELFFDDKVGEHFWIDRTTEKYIKESATCQHPAIYYRKCKYCGTSSKDIAENEIFEYGELGDHNYIENEIDSAKYCDANCTTPLTYYKTCSVCGEKSYETFTVGEALGHNYVQDTSEEYKNYPATCYSNGSYFEHCTRCGITGELFETDMLPHTFTSKETNKEALKDAGNCQKKSVYYYACANCSAISETETFEYEYGSHDYQNIVDESNLISAATCTSGASYYKKCSVCGEKAEENNYSIYNFSTEPLGHDFVVYIPATTYSGYAVAPTCTTRAKYEKRCSRCNIYDHDEANMFEYGEPLGHNMFDNYHYKETLSDTNYITSTCQREGCEHTETKDLIVPENSNVYNFVFGTICTETLLGVEYRYCYITGYKAFYGDDRDKYITVPETYCDAEIRGISSGTESSTVLTLTLNNTLEYCNAQNFKSLTKVISPKDISVSVSAGVPVCYTCTGTPTYTASSYNQQVAFYDYVEERANADYEYVLCKNDDGYYVSIKKYLGSSETVEIPETIDGYLVKYLAANSFKSDTLKKIIVPACVETAIKPFGGDPRSDEERENCSLEFVLMKGLKEPDGWKDDFNGYRYLDEGKDKYVEEHLYVYYYGVEKVGSYQPSESYKMSYDYIVYTDDGTTEKAMIIKSTLAESESKDVIVPISLPETIDGVSLFAIGNSAFKNATWLVIIYLPNIVEVREGAFVGCSNLKTVTFSEALKVIGGYAFYKCNQLTTVMGNATTSTTTGETTVPGSTAGVESIGDYAFYCCELSEFTFGDNLTTIGEYAFCSNNLEKVFIPDSLESIGQYAFGSNKIQFLNFGTNTRLHTIPKGAFSLNKIIGNGNATETAEEALTLVIPSSIYHIKEYAFASNSQLSSVKINSLSVGDYAFSDCESLTMVVLAGNVDEFGVNPFRGCSNLAKITYESDGSKKYMTSIEDGASGVEANELNCLYNTETNTIVVGTKNTIIADFITGFDDYAFYEIDLNYIYIPKTVTSFGKYSLYGIEHIFFESDTNPLTKDNSNYYESAKTSIYEVCELNDIVYAITQNGDEYEAEVVCAKAKVGGTVTIRNYIDITTWEKAYVTKIGANAFKGCADITTIVLTSDTDNCKLVEIGEGAFMNCSSLKTVDGWTASITTVGKDAFSGTDVSMLYCYGKKTGKPFEGVEIADGNEKLTGIDSTNIIYHDVPN